jgi:hypothetical protein
MTIWQLPAAAGGLHELLQNSPALFLFKADVADELLLVEVLDLEAVRVG